MDDRPLNDRLLESTGGDPFDSVRHLDHASGLLRPGGILTMATWFLLYDAMSGVARNDWESFAGPGWETRAVGIATKHADPSVALDAPMAADLIGDRP